MSPISSSDAIHADGEIRAIDPTRREAFLPVSTVQCHAASLAYLRDGTLTCLWFGGTMEGMGDISIYMSRLAPGASHWSAAEKLSDDSQRSEQNPLLFSAPDGRVWLLYTSQPSGNQDQSIIKRRISTDGGKTFGPVATLCDTAGTFIRQPIVINRHGEWLLPLFRCIGIPGERWSGDKDFASVLISRDAGETWSMHDVPESSGAVHMNIIDLGGDQMVAFYRHRFAENILRSRSSDAGRNWSAPEPTYLPNNNSSIQATRLVDGRIAMIYNRSSAYTSKDRRLSLYDEIEADVPSPAAPASADRRKAVWGVPRAPVSVAFSDDGGASFGESRDIETGDGYCLTNNSKDGLNRELSYPSIIPGPNGSLYLAFTYHRRAIKFVQLLLG